MMENFTGLFGVDIAIKKMRPDAKFAIMNTTIIEWDCPHGSQPPTWNEITEQIENDRKQINKVNQE